MDQTDKNLLKLLQKNGKATIKELANELHMSTTPVFERIKRLERDGVIEGYSALVDRKSLGLDLMVFCSLTLKGHNAEFLIQFEQDVKELSEVIECYHLTGSYDYLLKVIVRDMSDFQEFITKKLTSMANIDKVQSSFVLTELKNERVFPI